MNLGRSIFLKKVSFTLALLFTFVISFAGNPLKYVNPFICTDGDNGQLYPGATYPFGLVHLSPETEGDSHVGYYYRNQYIEGFSHLRIGGAGSKGKGGGLLIKPGIGKFTTKISEFREKYIKSSEEASPGYYKVILESGVKAELTVSERVGFHRYTFPNESKKERYVVIELSHSYVGMLDARLNVKNDHEITGMIKSLHNSGGGYHLLYFAIVSDNPFESYTSWKGSGDTGKVALRQGNIRGFFTPDGKPVKDVEEFEKYVYEGNLWHYRWFVLHGINGLANLCGGKEKLADDLEYFFEKDFYMHLNEPDIHAPFMFDYLGKPYLTQKWARTFTTKSVTQLYHNHGFFDHPVVGRIYRADTKGYIDTMDDDAGAMASWFVMSAMGLFPSDPVEPYYLIGSPIFSELLLHLDNGKEFRVVAKNVSEENFYIQSAKLNGANFDQPWIYYKTIMEGGTLEFEMGNQSNKNWGSNPDKMPPSTNKKIVS